MAALTQRRLVCVGVLTCYTLTSGNPSLQDYSRSHGHEPSRARQGEGETGLLQGHEEEEEEDTNGEDLMFVFVYVCLSGSQGEAIKSSGSWSSSTSKHF